MGQKSILSSFQSLAPRLIQLLMDFMLLAYGSPFSNMAETNWVSLQFDRHIQRQKNKVYRGKHRNTRKVRVMTVCLVKSNIRNIFKTTEEISKEACDIIGNETLEETKHIYIYIYIYI